MKALALESVIKVVIFTATALVLLNLLLYFSGAIKNFLHSELKPEEKVEAELIEAQSFSSAQIASYINSCWDRTGEYYKGDAVCYILKGDMSSVSVSEVKALVKINTDLSGFDPSKNIAIIEFRDLDNKIVVKS